MYEKGPRGWAGMPFKTLCLIIISIFLYVQTALAQENTVIPENNTTKDETSASEAFEAPEPETKGTNKTWFIVGGLAIAAAGAVAIGSSGGSSSSNDTSTTETTDSSSSTASTSTDTKEVKEEYNEYIGPDLSGSGWRGTVTLHDEDYVGEEGEVMQSVTATVYQEDANVKISISSSLPYANNFVGKISDGGYMVMKDQVTGKTWTTVSEVSSGNLIHLYDYVNDNTSYDIVYLTR